MPNCWRIITKLEVFDSNVTQSVTPQDKLGPSHTPVSGLRASE